MSALYYGTTYIDAEAGRVTQFASAASCDKDYDFAITQHVGHKTYVKANTSDPMRTCFDIQPYVQCTIISRDLAFITDALTMPEVKTVDDLANSAHAIVEPWSQLCDKRWRTTYGHVVMWLPEKNQTVVYYKVGDQLMKALNDLFSVHTVTMQILGMEYQLVCVSNCDYTLPNIPVPNGWKLVKDTVVMQDSSGFEKVLEEYGDYVVNNIGGTYSKVGAAYVTGKTIVWVSWMKKFILLHQDVKMVTFPKAFKVVEASFDEKVTVRIHVIADTVLAGQSFAMKPFKKPPTFKVIK